MTRRQEVALMWFSNILCVLIFIIGQYCVTVYGEHIRTEQRAAHAQQGKAEASK